MEMLVIFQNIIHYNPKTLNTMRYLNYRENICKKSIRKIILILDCSILTVLTTNTPLKTVIFQFY